MKTTRNENEHCQLSINCLFLVNQNQNQNKEYIVVIVVTTATILPNIRRNHALIRCRFNCIPNNPGTIKPSKDDVVPPNKPKTTDMFGITSANPNAIPASRNVTIECCTK